MDCYQLKRFGLTKEECEHFCSKTIYFIRHAESLYNTDPRTKHSQKCNDQSLLDCKLSEYGKAQAQDIHSSLAEFGGVDSFDLVVSSPMLRTRQTAAFAFKSSKSEIY